MKEKQVKLPGPGHPISIRRNPARVVVSVAGRVVADTRNALTLREAAYPPVQYIPGDLIKAIAITTVFPLEERSPSMRCGRTRIRIPPLRRSKDTWRSIPTASMR